MISGYALSWALWALPVNLPSVPDDWSPIAFAVAISIVGGLLIKFRGSNREGFAKSIAIIEEQRDDFKQEVKEIREQRDDLYEKLIRERRRCEKLRGVIERHKDIIPDADKILDND